MYKEFFGLTEEPFRMTPDPHFMYQSKQHMELLSCMHYGVQWRKGFIEITGEVGAGKTTVCRVFLEHIKGRAKTALILNPNLSELQLLEAVVEDFGIPVKKTNKKALFKALNTFLVETLNEGTNAVLIIDEAQNLSTKALEQIRLISNLETEKQKLIQIILVGQPELRDHLKKPNMKQLRQRVAVRYHLRPLDYSETGAYFFHRLERAGCPSDTVHITPQALQSMYEYTYGIPRSINVVADKVLLAAYVRETKEITYPLMEEAIREIEGVIPGALHESLISEVTIS